jgi:hypothetical protein
MSGNVTKKGNRYYVVIYEGVDPERRKSATAGTSPAPLAKRPTVSSTNSYAKSTTASTSRQRR